MDFVLYDAENCFDNKDFFSVMDMDAEVESRAAGVLCSNFRNFAEDVAPYGNLLVFQEAWMQPKSSKNGVFGKAANAIVSELFSDFSMLLLKAFPLEYEGSNSENPNLSASLDLRQNAMIRHYKKLFEVRSIGAPDNETGWLYKPRKNLRGILPIPQYEELEFNFRLDCLLDWPFFKNARPHPPRTESPAISESNKHQKTTKRAV